MAEAVAEWYLSRTEPKDALYLVTLTFDPRRMNPPAPGRQPRDYVGRRGAIDAIQSHHRVVRAYAPTVDVLAGLEAHKSGARHAHELVAVPPGYRWKYAQADWFARFGFVRWDRVERPEAAGKYAAKYAAKELGVWGVAFDGGDLEL